MIDGTIFWFLEKNNYRIISLSLRLIKNIVYLDKNATTLMLTFAAIFCNENGKNVETEFKQNVTSVK